MLTSTSMQVEESYDTTGHSAAEYGYMLNYPYPYPPTNETRLSTRTLRTEFSEWLNVEMMTTVKFLRRRFK